MKRGVLLFLAIAAVVVLPWQIFRLGMLNAGAEGASTKTSAEVPAASSLSAARAAREEKALQESRRQQVAEKEAAVAAKDAELRKLNDKLEAQIKAFEGSKKRLDDSLKNQKKVQDEKRKKMIGLFKKMRAEEAGQLMNKLDEGQVIALLDQMDTKTVIKLVPFLSQPRVLKWINENLKGS